MKRTISILLVIALALAMLSGCGSSGTSIAKDLKVMGMSFKVPKGCTEMSRYVNAEADGSIIEKDILFEFEDGSNLGYAFMPDQDLSKLIDLSTLESTKVGGKTFYYYTSGNNYAAFVQVDDDLYGIKYYTTKEDHSMLDDAIKAVKFSKEKKTVVDEIDLGKIKYDTKSGGTVIAVATTRTEDTKGNLTGFEVQWEYGEKEDTTDYRFIIEWYKNTSIDDLLDPEKEYSDEKVGGKDAKGRADSSGAVYDYFIQVGKDVYEIVNNGKSGWLGVTRTDASKEAFKKFVENIKF